MKRLIIGGIATIAIGLTGCGSNAGAPSSTPVVPPPVLPVSVLAPGVTLPAGSENSTFAEYRDHNESWKLRGSFDAVVSHLDGQLPSNRDFDGLGWCSKTVATKADNPGFFGYPPDEEVTWVWGDNVSKLRIHVGPCRQHHGRRRRPHCHHPRRR